MNTLTFLSRQFDVLASARTPPSTPTNGSPPFLSNQFPSRPHQDDILSDASAIKRVKTWSTKSFLFPPPQDSLPSPPPPKRSFSSPTDFITFESVRQSLEPPSPQALISSENTLKTFIARVFFIRLFVLVCHLLSAAWSSITTTTTRTVITGSTKHGQPVDDSGTDTDSKDLAQEITGEALVQSQSLEPPCPPSPLARNAYLFRIHPSVGVDQPSITVSTKDEPESVISLPPPTAPEVQVPAEASRTPTPAPTTSNTATTTTATRKAPFPLLPKTLVLDLDETLIHSTTLPIYSSGSSGSGLLGLKTLGRRNKGAGHMVEVVLGGRSTLYHVYKRPFVDFFLRTVSGWYTLVIFTASMQEYADPVIDWLDAGRGILARRLFRDSCTQLPNGSYTKDLSVVEQDLARVCLVDNSPICYRINEANGIPIEGWTHDPSDEALLDLLPVLDSLRFTTDVRRVLGIRGYS